ncbi:phosphoserine phosphatase SerB [Candidatus Methylospira mobilis]|uniref:Phosphoserine phosphatase n=1 Tax=Candidatus Methylospira mobilis TaxID=1808979 RepID=A0A5Q0BI56_9GAMM|nr:phosphoserine phosphatase SerB [Candidatus Methylospira mobilis]QFY42802.1 phosphoserine phosphatase SerB [Candidatus Methylospira mobilis]WNV03693.1 phosphoserine phosphatase SerB [Candidatus Methylospira mobilis]
MYLTIIHTSSLNTSEQQSILEAVPGDLECWGDHHRLHHAAPVATELLTGLRQRYAFDLNPLPLSFDPARVGLIISDMDSTLIDIECIDELAGQIGVKARVAEITERAMRGELVFADALRERVALLAGCPVQALQTVYDQRLHLNPGAEALITQARQQNVKTALVSGGFTFFTSRIQEMLAMDAARANDLEIQADRLTGRLSGPVCGPEQKTAFLQELLTRYDLEPRQAIAIGDGANDLGMLGMAGLGVAYHAKPRVQQAADVVINHGGLDNVAAFFRTGR